MDKRGFTPHHQKDSIEIPKSNAPKPWLSSGAGFTLMELLIVIAIIGILATVAITSYIGVQLKALRSEAYSNLDSLRLLEEQFFSENGDYTIDLGVSGSTAATRDANLTAIQTTVGNALPGFQPGAGANFSYRIDSDIELTTPVATPWAGVGTAGDLLCFIAIATGVDNTRVEGDVFVIDCNNNKNF